MKKLLLFLFLLFSIAFLPTFLNAQTNTARMISGVNYILVCPYTVQATDVTKLDVFNSASACVVNLPPASGAGFSVGTIFSMYNQGAGSVSVSPVSGTIGGKGTIILAQGQGMDVYSDGVNWNIQPGSGTGGGGGSIGTCTANYLAYWNSTSTIGCLGSAITGALLQNVNSAPPAFAVEGLPLGNSNLPVTSCPYTVQPDTSTTTVDRGTVLVFNSASACSVTINDPTVSGMGNSFPVKMANIGAGTVTIHRQTSATFTVVDGATVTSAATSFALSTGQYITLHSDNTNWWGEAVTGAGGGGGGVTLVSGTANQIDVATGGTTPVVSLDTDIILPGTLALNAGTAGNPIVANGSLQLTSSPLFLDASQISGVSGCSNLGAFTGACDTRALYGSQSLGPVTIGNGSVPTTFQFPDYCVWGITATAGAAGYTLNNLTNAFSNASDLRCELTNNSATNGMGEMVNMVGTYSRWRGPTVYNTNTPLLSGFGVVIDGPNDGSSFEGSVLNYQGGGIEIKNNFCCWAKVRTVINGDYTGTGPGIEVLGNGSGDPNGWFVEGSIGHQTGSGNSEVLVSDTSSGHLTWGAFGPGYTEHYNPGTSPMSFSGSLNVAVKDWEFKYTTGGETDPLVTIANVGTPSINIQDLACTVGCGSITAAISDSVAADSLSPPLLIPLNTNGTVPNYWNGVNYITHLVTPMNMETQYEATYDEVSTTITGVSGKDICRGSSTTHAISCSFNAGAETPLGVLGGGSLSFNGAPTVSAAAYTTLNGSLSSTTQATAGWPAPSASPISGLQVYSTSDPGSGNTLVFTLYDGSTAESVTCTITGSGGGTNKTCSDLTDSFTPAVGDLLTWKIAPTGTVVITPNITINVNWATPQQTALSNMFLGGWGSSTPTGSQYGYLLGKQSVLTGTAASAQFVAPRNMTFTGMYVNLSAAEGAAATLAVAVGVCSPNSAGACTPSAGSLSCTVGNSVAKCNTTGSQAATAGQLIVLITTQTGTGTTANGDVSLLYQ